MKIQIIGTGIVGEATAYLAKEQGNDVYGYDINHKESPYYNQGLVNDADIVFICVMETSVPEVVKDLVKKDIKGLYVVRSTVQPFTIEDLTRRYIKSICHNPEFLTEANHLHDSINPRVIVYSGRDYGLLSEFYSHYQGRIPVIHTDLRTSSIIKLFLNNYRATLITFWNNADYVCKNLGLDTAEVCQIMKKEGRVNEEGCNKFGQPYDGKCLPKDMRQTIQLCKIIGVDPSFWCTMEDINTKMNEMPVFMKDLNTYIKERLVCSG